MSKKGHNPWTRTFNGHIQKGVMDRRDFFQSRGCDSRFTPDRRFGAIIAKLEKTR